MENINITQLLIMAATYVWLAITLQIIAKKTNKTTAWLAWIPLLNILLMCDIAGRPGWWLVLFLLPCVNIVIGVIVWMGIAQARKKAAWLGILTIVPIVGWVAMGYLAFSK